MDIILHYDTMTVEELNKAFKIILSYNDPKLLEDFTTKFWSGFSKGYEGIKYTLQEVVRVSYDYIVPLPEIFKNLRA